MARKKTIEKLEKIENIENSNYSNQEEMQDDTEGIQADKKIEIKKI